MPSIKKLLERNPDILSIERRDQDQEQKRRREKYHQEIDSDFDELHEISKEYVKKVIDLPQWRMEYLDKMFKYGVRIGEEYSVILEEVERLFNEVLFTYVKGGLLGAFISGMYNNLIKKDDTINLNLGNYLSVSGIGFRHPQGSLKISGGRALYLGTEASGGEILAKGNMGNCVGKRNNGCTITVNGNVRNWAGMEMKDGLIKIAGNAGDILGEKMAGGEILIEGNAGYWVGDDMSGGVIRIKGDFTPSEERKGGAIYSWRDRWVKV